MNPSDPTTAILWECSLNSGHDDTVGSTDELGYFAKIEGRFLVRDVKRFEKEIQGYEPFFELRPEEIQALNKMVGAIVEQHSSGAIYGTVYTDKKDFESAWQDIEIRYQEFYTVECEKCGMDFQDYEGNGRHWDCEAEDNELNGEEDA